MLLLSARPAPAVASPVPAPASREKPLGEVEVERKRNFKFKTPDYSAVDETTKERLAKEAEKVAWKVFPGLFQKLQADFSYMESFPQDELGELLGQRLRSAIFQFFVWIIVMRMNQKRDIGPLARRIYSVFVREIKEYSRKYGEDLGQTVMKAKKGEVKAIYTLLKWDKSWIGFDFIHGQITDRGYRYSADDKDDVFLARVGDAIKWKPHIRDHAEETDFLSAIEFFANQYDLSGNENENLKSLHDRLLRDSAFDRITEKEGNLLIAAGEKVLFFGRLESA